MTASPFPVTQFQHPRLSIPAPLMMSEPESFAHLTLTKRWPAVVQRLIAENQFPIGIVRNLEALVRDLFEGTIRLLNDRGPDLTNWATYLQPYVGKPWIQIPWFFAEVYFYRRILEATQYFEPGTWHEVDPFLSQKRNGLRTALDDIRSMSAELNPERQSADQTVREGDRLVTLLYSGLWGNRADLSLHPTVSSSDVQAGIGQHAEQTHILVDDTAIVLEQLSTRRSRIDLIADNAGFELFCDLCLIDHLLAHHIVSTVYLHLKAHPTFVSDATIRDVYETFDCLEADADQSVLALVARLRHYINTGQLQMSDHFCWTAPLVFWEMLPLLQSELGHSSLVIIKGDANYRRLLGDCHWPFTTPFAEIVRYFPVPLVALRTLKAEVAAGLTPAQVDTLTRDDPNWLTNGHWGVIQFADRSSKTTPPC